MPRRALSLVLACSAFLACTPASSPVASAPQDGASVQRVLMSGSWRLIDYQTTDPLDPVTAALLAEQIKTMVLTFDGTTMHLQSPTLSLARPYAVRKVAGSAFDVVSPDPGGAGNLRSRCEIQQDGQRIVFVAQTNPWNGQGTLLHETP